MSEAEQQTERAEAPSEVQNNPPPLPARRKREREVSGPVQEEAAEAAPAPATTTKKVRGDESQPSFSSFASSASPFAGVKGNEEKKEEKEEEVKEKKSDEAKAGSKKDEKATDVANAAGADVPAVSMPTSTPAAAPAVMPTTETPGASVSSASTTPVSAPIATPITAPVSGATAAPIAAPVTGGPQLGFGAFAARSAPFKSATALSEKAVEAEKDTSNWTKAEKEEALQPDAQDIVVRKRSLRRPDTELTTGEEEEKTIYSARAKLFTMAKDQSWKERGTGAMKINLRTHENGTSARLVMRSDAVLKVILNVKLFPGMQCDLEQERFIRFVAMEEEGLVHFAMKLANANEAAAFLEQLQENIPVRTSAENTQTAS